MEKAMPKKFDPEGSGYDYESARGAGMKADKTGHWSSRVASGPKEGLILKGRGHKTFHLTQGGETRAGYKIYKRHGRYWSARRGPRKNP
jgi:hypothetical protein